MSNSLAGLALTAIAEETLPVLQQYTPMFNIISTDFSSEVATVGSAVSTRIPTAATAAAYSRTTGYSEANATASAVTVTLNKHYHYTVGFDDSEVQQIGLAKLQNTFIQPAIYAVVNQVQSDLFSLITTAYPATYSASYASFGFAGLMAAKKVLDNSGSMAPKGAFLNPNIYYDILDDVKANYVVADPSVLRTGVLPNLGGVKVAMSPVIGTGVGLAGFLCGKDAIAMAAAVPNIAGSSPVEVSNVTDPDSGFTIQLRKWYSPDKGMHLLSAVAIYGCSRGNTSSGVRIITTD